MAGDDGEPGHGLIGYAQQEFSLTKKQGDGASKREHLEHAARNNMLLGKKPPKQLTEIDLPYCLKYLWIWFCDLSGCRGYSEAGPLPLSYSEIQAWSNMTKSDPDVWEVRTIKKIDQVFINELRTKNG